MLYNNIQPQGLLASGEECFLPYTGMAAILLNGMDPFEQMINIPLTEGPCEIW